MTSDGYNDILIKTTYFERSCVNAAKTAGFASMTPKNQKKELCCSSICKCCFVLQNDSPRVAPDDSVCYKLKLRGTVATQLSIWLPAKLPAAELLSTSSLCEFSLIDDFRFQAQQRCPIFRSMEIQFFDIFISLFLIFDKLSRGSSPQFLF